MGSPKLKLYLTEECYVKLNASLLSRFFIPKLFQDDYALSKADQSECEAMFFYGGDKLEHALKTADSTACAVLMITDEADTAVLNSCTINGILYCTVSDFSKIISSVYAMRVRLARFENSNSTLRRKLDDSKLVSRAKLLLMQRLNMTEPQAHKYIEKTAMDGCISRRDVAISIIKTYED